MASAAQRLGGEPLAGDRAFWSDLREQRLAFFREGSAPLWRIGVPSTAAPLALPGATLVDWGGALRWVRTDASAESVRRVASAAGGHAMRFRGATPGEEVYHPLSPALLALHRRLKAAFDPAGILNPGRMYAAF